jgi:hypothetical protein
LRQGELPVGKFWLGMLRFAMVGFYVRATIP